MARKSRTAFSGICLLEILCALHVKILQNLLEMTAGVVWFFLTEIKSLILWFDCRGQGRGSPPGSLNLLPGWVAESHQMHFSRGCL